MSAMTPEAATALRKPFPKESVGKLPKGGTLLDYVGHAAVTDRLLTVDPEWSWEPLALNADGLPALDKSGNLWIKLTICGVTRLGVGDGKNAKEVVGDAIRNAAMRFGVALDLWAKENLVEFAQAARSHQSGAGALRAAVAPSPEPEVVATVAAMDIEASEDTKPSEPMTAKTRARLFATFGERGINDRDEQIRGMVAIIGRPLESRADLTEDEAQQVLARLKGGK